MSKLKIIIFSFIGLIALVITIVFATGVKYRPGHVMIYKTLPKIEYSIQLYDNNYVTTTSKKVAQYLSAAIQEDNVKMHFYLDTFDNFDKEEAKRVMYQVMNIGLTISEKGLEKKQEVASKLLSE